ncbi:hypothetical protein BJX76DRAFT_316768 [Aspergillus varians]
MWVKPDLWGSQEGSLLSAFGDTMSLMVFHCLGMALVLNEWIDEPARIFVARSFHHRGSLLLHYPIDL